MSISPRSACGERKEGAERETTAGAFIVDPVGGSHRIVSS